MRRYNEAMKGTKIILITGIIIAFISLIGVVTADNLEIIPITKESSLLEPTILISETERFHQEKPSMTFGGSYFYVAYQSYDEKENSDIFVKKYNLNWTFVEKKRITNDTSGQYSPSIVFPNNSKNLYLAYHSDETGKHKIIIQKYDPDLNPVGEPKHIVNETSDLSEPSIIITKNYFYVAYMLSDEKGNRYISVEKYDFNWKLIKRKRLADIKMQPTVLRKLDVSGFPSMAFANGNFYLAYCSYTEEREYNIFIEKYDLMNLNRIGIPKQITIDMGIQGEPSIIVVDNNLYIAYTSFKRIRQDIFVEKYNLDLTYLNRVQITTNEYGQGELLFAKNNFYMVYTTDENDDLDIYVRTFDPNTEETFKQEAPSLIFEDSHFYIAYHSNEKGNWDVWVKKYDFNWNIIEKKRITTNKYSQEFPSITFANDSFFIAYQSKEKGNCDIFVEKYDLGFNRIGDPKQITTDTSAQTDPSIISTENSLYIAYESNETGNADIFVEKYDLNLSHSVKQQITNDTYNQSNPAITFIKNILSVFYESDGDIFIKRYDLDLNLIEEKPIITDDDDQKEPTVIFANSSVYVAYQSKHDDEWCISVDKYDSDLKHNVPKKIEDKNISFKDSYPSVIDANGSLYLAFAADKKLYVVNVSNIPPVRPSPPPILIYSIIAGLFIFSVLIAYVKRDEFMTFKGYRYLVLVAVGIILFLFAYSLTYPDVKKVNIFIGSLLITYPLLIGTISNNARESFTFASVAFLCSLFGLLIYGRSIYGLTGVLGVAFGVYFALAVCSVAAQHLMSWLKEEVKQKYIAKFKPISNPYIAGVPITGKEMFFGRKDIFDFLKRMFIMEKAKNNISLYGGRRIGKTSTLYRIKGGTLGDEFMPVFMDLQGLGDLDTYGFFNFLTHEIRKTLGEKGIEMKEYVFDNAKESYIITFNHVLDDISDLVKDKQLLLMFDEIEVIGERIRKGKFDSGIYLYFESIMQHNPKVSCIFTSSLGSLRKRREGKPLFRAANLHLVTFLKKGDAIELIKKPVEGFAHYTDKVINRILRITGCHPFYIQYICYEIVSILNKEKRNNVKMMDIDSVINKLIKNAPMHLGYVWDTASYDEKIVLSLLSETIGKEDAFVSASAIEKYKNKKEKQGETTINLSERKEKILEDLHEEDILEKKDSKYRYRVDLIRHWVKGYHPVWRVIGEEEDESATE